MKLTSDILKTLSTWIKKTLWVLGLHAFLLILFFVLIDLIIGGFVFYKYVFLAEQQKPEANEIILKFDYKIYQDVLGELQAKNQASQGSLQNQGASTP